MTRGNSEDVRRAVREAYASVAKVGCGGAKTTDAACCGSEPSRAEARSQGFGYSERELESVPEGANMGLGCGNPTAIAALKPGQTVLDLGSGGGFDCFLAAKQVGAEGHVIGVDMTPEMIEKARRNAAKAGARNVEFRLGEIEHIPVADASVDVIISNCVINLSPDKKAVYRDAYRALKPGGTLAISDVVAKAALPEELAQNLRMVAGCIGGAATVAQISRWLGETGFADVQVDINEEVAEAVEDWAPGKSVGDYVASATITARKP